MISTLGKIWRRLHKNPYREARLHRVEFGGGILTPAFAIHAAHGPGHNSIIIGERTILGCEIHFETTGAVVSIGPGTFINAGSRLIASTNITIGHHVTIAWGVTIYDHDSHSLDARNRMADLDAQFADWPSGNFIRTKDWSKVRRDPIRIEDHAWIGFDAVILKGVTVGRGAVVGARSVVTRDVEPFTVVAGNPARVVKRLQEPEGLP